VPADSPLRAIVAFDKPVATEASRADAFNMTMRHGVKSTLVAGAAASEAAGLAVRNSDQNPHLRYLDSRANGYAVFVATPDRLEVEYVTLATVARRSPEVERRVRLHAPSWASGRALPAVEVGAVTGPPLFAAGN
jgi:alkaline phosphatase D